MREIGKPKEGETVVVSAAAGAVGSVAGQLAKLQGARVVGIAGGPEKCAWLVDELGFDAAIDRHDPDWREQLREACPNGVDVDFENVGGEIMDAVFGMLNLNARVALCGLISEYNDAAPAAGPALAPGAGEPRADPRASSSSTTSAGSRRRSRSWRDGWPRARSRTGTRSSRGSSEPPEAMNMLFDGENVGKLIVKIDMGRRVATRVTAAGAACRPCGSRATRSASSSASAGATATCSASPSPASGGSSTSPIRRS